MSELESKLIKEYISNGKHEQMSNYLQFIDNTKILGNRINELAATLCIANKIYEQKGRKFKDIQLFEAGNNPGGELDEGLYSNNTGFFFLNHPKIMNYKGYDPKYKPLLPNIKLLNNMDIGRQKIKKLAITPKQYKSNYIKNQIKTYTDFQEVIETTKDPIIFSNFVLGCPKLKKENPFWKIKGAHIHTILTGDLEIEWIRQFYPREFNVLNNSNQGREEKYEQISLEFMRKNEFKQVQEIILKTCTELFEIPKNTEYININRNQTIIIYNI